MNAPANFAAEENALAEQMLGIMVNDLMEKIDRPEMWKAFPQFLEQVPGLADLICLSDQLPQPTPDAQIAIGVLAALVHAYDRDDLNAARRRIAKLATENSENVMVQGAMFHIESLLHPDDPKYNLEGKICSFPFEELHVLEGSTHQCCASWLPTSAGNLHMEEWQQVWNSHAAQSVRASVHDGSYRHCNKMACPRIQQADLPSAEEIATKSDFWKQVIETQETELSVGPKDVNLAYDRTCNLSCPSCRVEKYAADGEKRKRYDRLQDEKILPMLRGAKSVFITGSGDPFASKNFRRLIEQLGPEDYPDLRFRIMTNAMLLTPREWERFPALHGRVERLQISIDGASAQTHEALRRGARWSVMQENLRFAASLRKQGLISELLLSFTVQNLNYHEMGAACDLTEELEADTIYFGKITNWGTFSPAEYAGHAVFDPAHPNHDDFLIRMADPRLLGPRVWLGNLSAYLPQSQAASVAA